MLKYIEIFTIGEKHSTQHHGVSQNYCIIKNFKNKQTMVQIAIKYYIFRIFQLE